MLARLLSYPLSPTTESGCSPAVSVLACLLSAWWPSEVSWRRMRPRPLRLRPMLSALPPRAPVAVQWRLVLVRFHCAKRRAVGVQHVRLGERLRILHYPVEDASLATAEEPLLRRLGRRHQAAKFCPGQVGPHHNEAGADEAVPAVQVPKVHLGHRLQSDEHGSPHRVLNKMLFHAHASIVPRNTMMARVGPRDKPVQEPIPRQNFAPRP